MKRNESQWGLIGLDTDSGKDVFNFTFYQERLPSLKNFWSNPYYAGVEAVGPRALAIGSIGGVTFLTPQQGYEVEAALGGATTPLGGLVSVLGVVLLALIGVVIFVSRAITRDRRARRHHEDPESLEDGRDRYQHLLG